MALGRHQRGWVDVYTWKVRAIKKLFDSMPGANRWEILTGGRGMGGITHCRSKTSEVLGIQLLANNSRWIFRCCLCLRLWRKVKSCVKCMWIYEFLFFLLLKNQSLSLIWLTQIYSTNKYHMLQSCPRNKPFLKSKAIYPALPQHWALPVCRNAASHAQWDADKGEGGCVICLCSQQGAALLWHTGIISIPLKGWY